MIKLLQVDVVVGLEVCCRGHMNLWRSGDLERRGLTDEGRQALNSVSVDFYFRRFDALALCFVYPSLCSVGNLWWR